MKRKNPRQRRLNTTLCIRVTDEQLEIIEDYANEKNQAISEATRDLMMAGIKVLGAT